MGTQSNFKAIVVGSGVSGLTLSHVFQKAGIDHVVLERGSEPAPPWGASIAIYPHGARILSQLGMLKAIEDVSGPLSGGLTNRWPDGTKQLQVPLFSEIDKNHGHDFMLLERRAFLQAMYDNLPNKEYVKCNKKVKEIVETTDGVEVLLADGTVEKGDIVVGADGVHSTVREAMWTKANNEIPGYITVEEKKAIHTEYTCLLGFGPPEPHLPNELSCTYGKDRSFLLGAQPNATFFFAFEKVPTHNLFNAKRYNDADAEACASRMADCPVSETMMFGELWKKKHRGCLVDVEQGVLENWFYGRTVLVGDSVHKVTPNMALGGNSGIESAAVLGNVLNSLLASHPKHLKPTKAQIASAFKKYESERKPRMKEVMEFSKLHTRVQAWKNPLLKWFALYALPLLPKTFAAEDIAKIIKKAPKLDFMPVGKWPEIRIPYDTDAGGAKEEKSQVAGNQSVRFFGVMVALSSLAYYFQYGNLASLVLK